MPLYSTETNDSGFFAFPGVQGAFRLQASKLGYTPRTVDPIVRGAMLMRIALAQRFYADTLIAGAWVKSSVPEEAPPCDPEGWDANAPCMRFFFEAPGSGTLKVSITWVGKPELDIVLMSESGAYIGFSDREGVEGAVLKSQVSSGKEYEVRVNSYYGAQAFQIKAELVP